MAAPQLTFEPISHSYTLDGQPVPSVTTVLSFGRDLSRIPEWTSARGTAFHLASEYYDVGDLDLSSVDPLVRPHLDAYIEWHTKREPTYLYTEERVWSEIDGMLYCGTIDRVMLHPRGHHLVVDLKSGSPRSEHGQQLAAYRHAHIQRTGAKDVACMGLYCGKDGKWVEKDYNGAHLFEGFRAKLRAYYAANGGTDA